MRSKKRVGKNIFGIPKTKFRLNFKAVGIVTGVSVVLIAGIVLYNSRSSESLRSSALEQAKSNVERNEFDLALRHLDRFLTLHPEDIEVLEAKADILSKLSYSADRVKQATDVHDQLIRLDPDGKNRLATRRRLVELYITYGELVRNFAVDLNDPQIEAIESRYQAAVHVADELIRYKDPKTGVENGTIDSAAHRLKAMAYMGQVPGLVIRKPDDSEALKNAKVELEIALKMDPSEYVASEKLAELYLIHLKDPVNSEATLDQMLVALKNKKFENEKEAKEASLKVRLSRFRAFYRIKEMAKAQLELEAALEYAPDNLELRTSAAGLALQRGDNLECRNQLDKIPLEIQKENLRVRFLRGALEFAERHPDEAIDQWRKGLSLVGGGDLDLTWRLASNLIQFNRLKEAEPLVQQYLRLSKPNDPLGIYLEAMYLEKSGRIKPAIEMMSKASNLVPSSFKADVLMSLGHCYELIGEEDRALSSYKQAANLGGNSSGPRRSMARLYLTSNPARAIEELEIAFSASKANGSSKGDPNILTDLIRIKLDRQMKLARADRDLREVSALIAQAQEIAPENPILRGLTAQFQSLDNRLNDAMKTLEETVKGSNRKRTESWLAFAEALELLGRLPDAIRVLDQGMNPDAAGDHASMRTYKARILLKMGLGTEARNLLTTNLGSVPEPERPELTKALGDLLQELGDRSGAREAYLEWSRMSPESPYPALRLLSIAQLDGDDEAAAAGLESLSRLGRANEPYGLAARALQLLRTDPTKPGGPPPDRIEKAQALINDLNRIAPDFPVKFMIQGLIYEYQADPKEPKLWREKLTKASEEYRKSLKTGTTSPALPKLIEIYMKLKDNDKLNLLKVEYDDGSQRHKTQITMEFDRLSTLVALRLGLKDQAEKTLKEMLGAFPDNREVHFADAKMLIADGKIIEAEAALQDLVKNRPQDPLVWFELIKFQDTRRSAAEVARTIEQARQKYTGDHPDLFLAQCYFAGRDIPNASREFQKAYDRNPDDVSTLASLVDFRDFLKQSDQVEPLLRKILKLDPKASWAARNLALRLSAKPEPGAWLEAWSLVSPDQGLITNTPEDRLMQATILARSPEAVRRAEAIPAFAKLANDLQVSHPVGIDARQRLAMAMLELDRPIDSWQYISPLTDDLVRPNVLALAIGVETLSRMGKPDEAEKRLQRLGLLMPNSPQILISEAWVLQARGKKKEAGDKILGAYELVEKAPDAEATATACLQQLMRMKNLDAALVLAKKMANRWPKEANSLARIQVAREEYDDALNSCRIALTNGSAYEALQSATQAAISRRSDKKFLAQVEELGKAARAKEPKNYNILICMATIYHLQDQYDLEQVFYRMILEQNPANRSFMNNMAWTLCEGLNKPDEALQKINDLIKQEGPAPQYLDTRGVVFSRLKQFDKAIADLEQSVKDDPSALTYYHLARTYLQAGKRDESRRCRQKALEKGFDMRTLDPTDKSDLDAVMNNQ